MKTYIADEGNVWKNGEEVLGKILYTPDDFDDSNLIQIEKPKEEEV
jgi:hypothetical protein